MALNFASMLLQPTKTSPWDLGGGGGRGSMQLQQLQLAREKLELEKKKADETRRQHELAAKTEATRAAALKEKERLDREATQQAALLKQQQDAVAKFGELAGSGKVEAAQAMVPYLDQLGYSVTDLGGIGGLPVFELQNRAQEAAREEAQWESQPRGLEGWDGDESAQGSLARMDGMGLPTDTRGQLDEPAGIGSTEDAFANAQAASAYSAATGKPARAPDEEDYTGAVPRNVIDLPAQQQATMARLRPMFGAIQESYPDAYKDSAGKTAEAALASGAPALDALALFKDMRQSPDELIKAGIQADAQKEQFREKRDQFTPMDVENFKKRGWDEAESVAAKGKIPDAATGLALGDTVLDLLEDSSGANDTMIAGALMDMQAIKGIPSDRDMEMAFGTGKMSFIDQVLGKVQELAVGGFSDVQREALRSFVKRTQQNLQDRVYNYLDTADAPGSSYNEHVRAGFRDKARNLVGDAGILGQYDEDRAAKRGKKSAAGKGVSYDPSPVEGDFDIELESQAMESDLDPEKVKAIIGPESGGRANARNKDSGATGLIQFLPSIAEDMGTSTEELAKMSATEQLPFVMRYLSDRGVTSDSPPEDYAMAVAAPNFIGKPPETVVYPKGSKAWEQNPAWRPAGGGDITVGSIQAYYQGSKKGAAAPKTALPEPTTAYEKRLRELMEREAR